MVEPSKPFLSKMANNMFKLKNDQNLMFASFHWNYLKISICKDGDIEDLYR